MPEIIHTMRIAWLAIRIRWVARSLKAACSWREAWRSSRDAYCRCMCPGCYVNSRPGHCRDTTRGCVRI